MEPYVAEAGFPVSGLAEVTPFGDQEAGTSPDMNNVMPFDSKGRLRGGRRPGLTKHCPDQINGTAAIQCIEKLSATHVKPVLGDGTAVINGKTAASNGMAFKANDGSGTNTDVTLVHTYLGSVFGPDGKCYVIEFTGTDVFLTRVLTDGTAETPVAIFVAGAAVSSDQLYGLCADEDTIYVWYESIGVSTDTLGEGIMRLKQSDGSNRDSTTGGIWIRAENDATNIERVFGGVSGAGWDPIVTASHSCMVTYLGYLIVVGAPDLSTAPSTNQLVVYVINTKTGIPDAVSDLGIDGSNSSTERGIFYDLAIGLDGFIYVLYHDDADTVGNTVQYIRKLAVDGTAIWEIEHTADPASSSMKSICWVPDRNVLAVCGINVLGSGQTLAIIDPDSKGVIDYAKPSSISFWDCVRATADGTYILWRNSATNTVYGVDAAFSTTWTSSDTGFTDQARISVNAFYNSGTDEQGSTRYQKTLAISNGKLKIVDTAGVAAPTAGDGPIFSTSQRVIYGAPFGVLCFFADGANHYYYDSVSNSVKDWAADVTFGALPEDTNGGFANIETWNRRLLVYGLDDDPNNYSFSAQGNPFDWKRQQGVAGAAINGTLSPAGRYPGKLVAAIPFNDDILIMAGDHSIRQMTLDPAVDSVLDTVSDTVGIAPGRAWCKSGGGSGAIYFFGSNGGMYQLGLDREVVRISNRTIDDRFTDLDIPNTDIYLQWDRIRQGIWILIRPHTNDEATQYFFDIRTGAYFPLKFANADYNAVSSTILDLDNPKDAKVLIGGSDGYIRYLDDAVSQDDSTAFESHFVLGPWVSRSGPGYDIMMESLDVTIGTDSYLTAEVLSGPDPESVVSEGRTLHTAQCRDRRLNHSHPRIAGRAVALKLSTKFDQDSEFEGARMLMREQRSI